MLPAEEAEGGTAEGREGGSALGERSEHLPSGGQGTTDAGLGTLGLSDAVWAIL